MKNFILILLFGIGLSCFGQEAPKKKTITYQNEKGETIETTKPIFQFEKESHDFGEIEQGSKHEYSFKFTNVGLEPLIIITVDATCGCTIPDWSEEPIMPGETSIINVAYDSTGKPVGTFDKRITIRSNALSPTKYLFIKGVALEKEAEMPVRKEKSLIESIDEDEDN